jgi:hypothetical protein
LVLREGHGLDAKRGCTGINVAGLEGTSEDRGPVSECELNVTGRLAVLTGIGNGLAVANAGWGLALQKEADVLKL